MTVSDIAYIGAMVLLGAGGAIVAESLTRSRKKRETTYALLKEAKHLIVFGGRLIERGQAPNLLSDEWLKERDAWFERLEDQGWL